MVVYVRQNYTLFIFSSLYFSVIIEISIYYFNRKNIQNVSWFQAIIAHYICYIIYIIIKQENKVCPVSFTRFNLDGYTLKS